MAFWCQKKLLVLTLFVSISLSAAQQLQHDELWEFVKNINVEQSKKPDVLLKQLQGYVETSQMSQWLDVETLAMSKVAAVYNMLEQFDKAKSVVDKYLPIAQKQKYSVSLLELLPVLLQYYDNKRDLENVIKIREKYEREALAFSDKKLIATMYIYVALSKKTFSDREASLLHLQKALKISENINYQIGKGAALNAIAIIYDEMEDYEQALEYYLKAMEIYKAEDASFSLSVLYFNIGHTYYTLKNFSLAHKNLQLALELSHQLNDEVGEGYALSYLGKVAFVQNEYEQANSHFINALSVFKRFENHRMHFFTSLDFAELQAKMGDVNQAMAFLNSLENTAKTLNDSKLLLDYYLKVYELEKLRKNFSSSLSALENVKEVQQDINEQENNDSLQELMVKFKTKQKEAENKLLLQQNELTQLQLIEQNTQKTIFILIIICSTFGLFVISLLLYRQIINRNSFKRMALRDELTGAPNRRAIITIAERRFKQCFEERTMLTIAMLDIDYFKNFNDSYGHDVGDKVLKIFSNACQTSLRNHDRYGRYGGEEWLLVLLDAKESDITVIFNRLRARLKEAMLAEGQDMPLTFSLGATQLTKGDNNLNQLIKRADENVYKAKNNGRDQCIVCG
ncbi:MAG: GGDEF domain-containing protein [Colwellia sp.]|nr:GGDEF domain-containing protein [Colwellia sp.]